MVCMVVAALLTACASVQPSPSPASSGARASAVPSHAPSDVQWLNRVTFGLNASSLEELRRRGRKSYLDWQLSPPETVPPEVTAQLQALTATHTPPEQSLAQISAENKRINTLAEGPEKEAARKALNDEGNKLAYEAQKRELMLAIYSPAQLREQMVAFWLNHFSVFVYKANVRWLVDDYVDRAIRPRALGSFRDLVLATLTHPAMLQYLDNAQNAAGHVNENLARELMELHTLGVSGGYSQQDVQNLARILTGLGTYNGGDVPKLKAEWQPLYKRTGGMEFNPARHDFGDKTLLGTPVKGSGYREIEQAVDLLVRSDACAHFIARKLVVHFVADDPPPALVERVAKSFRDSHGAIATVMRTLLNSPEFNASLGHKYRDPLHFVVASLRLAYDDTVIVNAHPVVNWLSSLGQPLFGRLSPDGYAEGESAWASSGQLSRRFEIARAIGSGGAGLFEPEDGSPPRRSGFPILMRPVFYAALEPMLSSTTRNALTQANSQQEWNTFLLSSPELNYR
jgi:uncharacterized protein (DUF1800 family)